MDERTKNILSYVLSILFVGGIITSFIIDTYNSLLFILFSVLIILSLFVLSGIVMWLKGLLYDFFSSNTFQKTYRKYISKHYKSKTQLCYERGNEICAKCDTDCGLKYPLRIYDTNSYCRKIIDMYIKEHKLKVE